MFTRGPEDHNGPGDHKRAWGPQWSPAPQEGLGNKKRPGDHKKLKDNKGAQVLQRGGGLGTLNGARDHIGAWRPLKGLGTTLEPMDHNGDGDHNGAQAP